MFLKHVRCRQQHLLRVTAIEEGKWCINTLVEMSGFLLFFVPTISRGDLIDNLLFYHKSAIARLFQLTWFGFGHAQKNCGPFCHSEKVRL